MRTCLSQWDVVWDELGSNHKMAAGGMRERPNRTVSKTVVSIGHRGFKSHSLRPPKVEAAPPPRWGIFASAGRERPDPQRHIGGVGARLVAVGDEQRSSLVGRIHPQPGHRRDLAAAAEVGCLRDAEVGRRALPRVKRYGSDASRRLLSGGADLLPARPANERHTRIAIERARGGAGVAKHEWVVDRARRSIGLAEAPGQVRGLAPTGPGS
jgi:hypothetical protein